VKTLPQNPNLDHLRAQARELLDGMREARPAATLTEAQTALAGQYGFRTWPELKAEVDRLRALPDAGDPAVGEAVAECFGLGRAVRPMTRVIADEVGVRWSLETGDGRWSVRELATGYERSAEQDVRLQEAAAATGVLLPAPVRSRAGGVFEAIDGRNWRVHESADAEPPLVTPVAAEVAGQVGEALARIHGLGLRSESGVERWLTFRRPAEEWRTLARAAAARGAAWAPALQHALPELTALAETGVTPPPEPLLLTHCSLGPGNARLRDGRLLITGWEHAGAQPAAWELGAALVAWALGTDRTVNTRAAHALWGGYRTAGGTVPALDVDNFSASISAWLNWTHGQAAGALEAPDGERRRTLDRSAAQLLSRPLTRAGLDSILLALA
jgi:hypothetical protein